jgi:hypothetical protein
VPAQSNLVDLLAQIAPVQSNAAQLAQTTPIQSNSVNLEFSTAEATPVAGPATSGTGIQVLNASLTSGLKGVATPALDESSGAGQLCRSIFGALGLAGVVLLIEGPLRGLPFLVSYIHSYSLFLDRTQI